MSEAIVGQCPKCGCPIYQEEYWAGTGHAPVIYVCKCSEEGDIRADERNRVLKELGFNGE